jgi:hypothetical protein
MQVRGLSVRGRMIMMADLTQVIQLVKNLLKSTFEIDRRRILSMRRYCTFLVRVPYVKMDEFPEIIALFIKSWMRVETYLESASCSPPHTRKEVLRVLLKLAHNKVESHTCMLHFSSL